MTYAIFEVFDYKGGELSSSINLSKERLVGELADHICNNYDFEEAIEESLNWLSDNKKLELIKKYINHCINDNNFFSTYAGGDGFCGEIYQIDGDSMINVNFLDFLEDIALHFLNEKTFEDDEE
jgi:hypothetical protein